MRKAWSHRVQLLLVVGGVLTLAACAATRETVDGWFGSEPVAGTTGEARVYYAGTQGMRLYSEPSSSSKVTGQLALHEKVTRRKLDRGYAYVETASGQSGWVNNAQLIWRLPAAAPGAETETPADTVPAEEDVSQPTATATEPSPAPTPVPASPRREDSPGGVAPSIFDAY